MAVPKYSLLVPVRNEADRIAGVVRSIFADLGGNPAWEVVIADDASGDGTRERLAELAAAFPFRLLAPPRNLGRGRIRNLLSEEARSGILVFLDGDSRPQPGFFKAWEDLDPEAAWIGKTSYEALPASGFSRFLEKGSGMGKLRGAATVPPAYLTSQNLRLPKAALLAAGGFRADLPGWGGEDLDLGYRLARLGVPLRYRPEADARHPSVTDLEGYLARLESFGRDNLPALIADYPALAAQFKLGLARPPWSLLFLNPVLDACCRALILKAKAAPWPFALYRYALFNRYARGYRKSAPTR
jgi:glycosyltransferase involved in cell wall biosynthesis